MVKSGIRTAMEMTLILPRVKGKDYTHYSEKGMSKKTVSVSAHNRSKPSTTRKTSGSKSGPKTVSVEAHKRSK